MLSSDLTIAMGASRLSVGLRGRFPAMIEIYININTHIFYHVAVILFI